MLSFIIVSIAGISLFLLAFLVKDIVKHKDQFKDGLLSIKSVIVGFIANFLDTFGVGSFAVVITMNRFLKLIPDHLLIGTLFVGIAAFPLSISTIYFIKTLEVDPYLLIASTLMVTVGCIIGAKLLSGFSARMVRMVVGAILVVVGAILIIKMLVSDSSLNNNTLTTLPPTLFTIGVIGSFIIGILQGFGLGSFAPILALFSMLGLSPKSIYPIMFTGACLGVLAGSFQYVSHQSYSKKVSISLTIGGVIGVSVALQFLTNIDVGILNSIIAMILIFVGVEMYVKGYKNGL